MTKRGIVDIPSITPKWHQTVSHLKTQEKYPHLSSKKPVVILDEYRQPTDKTKVLDLLPIQKRQLHGSN
jgi:hypothetical protein